jgi:hypothetical protein
MFTCTQHHCSIAVNMSPVLCVTYHEKEQVHFSLPNAT